MLPVRISWDTPRFWPRAQSFPVIEDIVPDRWMLSIKDRDRAGQAYRRKLDEAGIEQIEAELDHLATTYQRPLVLACFETDPHYHGRVPEYSFESWYETQTGNEVREFAANHGLAPSSHTDLSGQLRLVWDCVASLGEVERTRQALRSSSAAAAV